MPKDVRVLFARGVIDPEFKQALLDDFAAVAKAEGVSLSKSELDNYSSMTEEDWDFLEEKVADFVKFSPCPDWKRPNSAL